MNYGGDAAEQVVRMSLEGVEVAARITGTGAKNIALLLAAVLKEEQKTKGKARLTNMLKSGKELKVYTIQNQDLKKFSEEAKRYGVLYCVLKDKNDKSDTAVVDVIARAEDASKIQRITERFQLATVDTATVMGGVRDKDTMFPSRQAPVKDKLDIDKKDADLEMIARDGAKRDPSPAKAEKSPLSEPNSRQESRSNGSATGLNSRPSVREKLDEYKVKAAAEREKRSLERATERISEAAVHLPKTKQKER
ncbi:PcfB family protein [Hornefia butyriciproducens]|uniref:PcfB family protein n=1 Tax=Hornefia butyriciproducens TaxID=2652293 RepID=UPI003D056A6E